ncbi:hypothetical protein BTW07_15125 [Salinicola socius]|uniref:YjbF family lipoprotein n=2 Tax=Halomonadaceae TaxID=28256 RepID=A0A1Q8SPT7_9GAMM|nr:hypothetical protein BTW07_15125 [Salinicola socius]
MAAGFSGNEISAQADSIPYASVDLHVDGYGGLVILASQVADLSYWQFRDGSTVALQDGYLHSSAGLEQNLIDTQISDVSDSGSDAHPWRGNAAMVTYRVTREWKSADGYTHRGQADASLDCDTAVEDVELPLMSLKLQACRETLAWDDGTTTYGTLWRTPEDGRLWAVETQPWPGAPTFDWQVARPW